MVAISAIATPESPADIAAEIGSLTTAPNDTPSAADPGGLAEFLAEGELPASPRKSIARAARRRRWIAGAAASLAIGLASIAPSTGFAVSASTTLPSAVSPKTTRLRSRFVRRRDKRPLFSSLAMEAEIVPGSR